MSRTDSLHEPDVTAPLGPAAAMRYRSMVYAETDRLVSVTDLAAELGVTARTLRFYEDKGLIAPRRVASARVYSHRERARMILILRGKTLGFSIREIKDYLDLYDADPTHEVQTRALLAKIAERRRSLQAQRDAIDQAIVGLDDLESDAEAMLRRGGSRREPAAPSEPHLGTMPMQGSKT